MKIAFITDIFPAIGSAFILDQITALNDLGHEIHIIADCSETGLKVHDKVRKYNLDLMTFYTAPPSNILTRIQGALQIMKKHVPKNKEILRFFNIAKYGKRSLGFTLFFRAEPFLKENFDIIHCHFGQNGLIYQFLKNFIYAPLIISFYGADYSSIRFAKSKAQYKNMFKNVDLVTAPSHYAVKKVINLGCPVNKIIRIPLGIDFSLYPFKERHYRANIPIRILTVTRFVEKKGLPYAMHAISEISKRYPVHFEIVGRGDPVYQHALQELARKLNIENIVAFSGPKTARELSLIYQQSHIFLMASHTASDGDEESQGVVLAEAQACGLPIVATRHNGFPESIIEGKSGFLAEEKNVSSLVEELEKLIRVSDKWPDMGRRGRQYVEDNFDINKIARKIESQYARLIRDTHRHKTSNDPART